MKAYEALIIFPIPTTGESAPEGKNQFEECLRKLEGKVLNRTDLGKRLLGYRVKKSADGYFVSFTFELDPLKMDSFKRSLNLVEGIVKYSIIRKPKPKANPLRQMKPRPSRPLHATERK